MAKLSLLLGLLLSAANASPSTSSTTNARVLSRSEQVSDEYDYVIAGGGTAGLTVGDRLSADGKYSVLVIEYGDFDNSSAVLTGGVLQGRSPTREFSFQSVPQPELNNRSIQVVTGKLVGGSSGINGLQVFRGTKEEYDLWAQLGNNESTWDWNGLLPYFKRGMHFVPPLDYLARDFNISWDLHVWGREESTRVFAGYPNYLPSEIKALYGGMAVMSGVHIPKDGNAGTSGLFFYPSTLDPTKYSRSYARTGHLDGLERPNYEILVKSKVTKVEFEGDRAIGLSFVSLSNNSSTPRIVKARKQTVLAAGTIFTPQILQLSGIGPYTVLSAAGIKQKVDLPGVGENFQDHGYFWGPSFQWGTQPPVPAVNSSGDPKTALTTNCGAVIGQPAISPSKVEELAQSFAAQDPAEHLPKNVHPHVLAGYKAQKDAFAKIFSHSNTAWMWTLLRGQLSFSPANQHPLARGSVHINASDPEGFPVVDYRAFSNPIDVATTTEMLRFVRRYMGSEFFRPYVPVERSPGANVTTDAEIEAWLRRNYVPSVYHPVGTASKMPRGLGGVVDEELQVYGVEDLSVVDASIMPIIPGAPTVLTTYAVAEKAADLIKKRTQ